MILMNDFRADPTEVKLEERCAVERVLNSGWFILGEELQRFVEAWAKFCGVRFAVGVGNGMDALEIGLRCLNIGPGDEVITTPMTAMATVLAIIRAGATPVFADILPETALLDSSCVSKCITKKTKAVLLVHLYGQIARMDEWKKLCDANGIHLLEDCAQAHGACSNRQRAGSFGTWGAFSFYPTKNLGAKGDGGALVSNSQEIASKARRSRNYGQIRRYEHSEAGLNSRLDEMQAAVLSARLNWLDRFNARRRAVATTYFSRIKNTRLELLAAPVSSESHVHHLFVLRCAQRDRFAAYLRERGVETLIHYPIPMHRQAAAHPFSRTPIALPQTELHAQQCLSIPCHPAMTDDQVSKVVAALNAFE